MKKEFLILSILYFILIFSCSKDRNIVSNEPSLGLQKLVLYSSAIANNEIGESGERTIWIYLPPQYDENGKLYPVVYYAHGFMQSSFSINLYKRVLNEWFSEHPEDGFILVGIDGDNQFRGSFYTDSPRTGYWETHIIKELIPIIEEEFRVISSREARGIAGFSMGGYAAWELGLKYPDFFNAILPSSPCAFGENNLQKIVNFEEETFLKCYGSAFAWDNTAPDGYSIPQFNGTPADEETIRQWEAGCGNIRQKVEGYISQDYIIENIMLVYGSSDYFEWVIEGTQYLDQIFTEYGIPHTIYDHKGKHEFTGLMVKDYLLPFFVNAFRKIKPTP